MNSRHKENDKITDPKNTEWEKWGLKINSLKGKEGGREGRREGGSRWSIKPQAGFLKRPNFKNILCTNYSHKF